MPSQGISRAHDPGPPSAPLAGEFDVQAAAPATTSAAASSGLEGSVGVLCSYLSTSKDKVIPGTIFDDFLTLIGLTGGRLVLVGL